MDDTKIIQVPVTLNRLGRKVDRSVTLSFTTLFEVTNEDFAVMDSFFQDAGHLMFRKNSFTHEDIPDEDVETDVAKSQSTQIRDALWVWYRAKGGKSQDKEAWNIFYRKQAQTFKARILEEVHKLEETR